MSDPFSNLTAFLEKLSQHHIAFTLVYCREDSIMVSVVVPGEHWEIAFFIDGNVETERFTSSGEIGDAGSLDEFFQRFSD
jgi:hypothetical protein